MSDTGNDALITDLQKRIDGALEIASSFGMEDGEHHKMWVIDQMVRHLTGCPLVSRRSDYPDVHGQYYDYMGLGESAGYQEFVRGEAWDEGITP